MNKNSKYIKIGFFVLIGGFILLLIFSNISSCSNIQDPDAAMTSTTTAESDAVSDAGSDAYSPTGAVADTANSIDIPTLRDGIPILAGDNSISLFTQLVYPDSKDTIPSSAFTVDTLAVSPNKNWFGNIDGNTLTLRHSDGSLVYIVKRGTDSRYSQETTRSVLDAFSSGIAASGASYGVIYYEEEECGQSVHLAAVDENSKEYNIDCSVVTVSSSIYEFIFIYAPDSEEVILGLKGAVTIKGSPLIMK